jgi:hypothetical protein
VSLSVGVDFTYFDVTFCGQPITQAVTQVQMSYDTISPLIITLARKPPVEYVYVDLFGGMSSCAYEVVDFDWIGFSYYKEKQYNLFIIGICTTLSDVFYGDPFPGGWHPQTEIWYLQARGPTCAYALNPASASHGVGAATGSFGVIARAGCAWSASTSDA